MSKTKNAGAATEPVATPETIEEALEMIAKHEATIEEQKELIAELNSNNSDLEKKIAEYKTGVPIMPEVEINGVKYQVNNGSRIDGKNYTREELAANIKACESILAISGQLTITPVKLEEEAE